MPSVDPNGQVGYVPVRVVPMTARLAKQWHLQVQPLIDSHYVLASVAQASQATRADVGWNWPRYRLLAGLHSLVSPAMPSGSALAMSIVLDTGTTGLFPIGMLTTVPRLYCNAFGSARHRGFAWFLADAPSEVYSMLLKRSYVKGVAKALLDCGIQAAFDQRQDGTFLLHADSNGGKKLVDFYRDKCLMDQLPAGAPPITWVFRRGGSDEYFHFDDLQSLNFCRQFDPHR
jgi:hypothetical protein